MNWDVILYIGASVFMLLVFGALMVRAYSKSRKHSGEEAKHRMMDDD